VDLVNGEPFYAVCVVATFALVGMVIFLRRRFFAITIALLLVLVISLTSLVGVQSSARLAEVRAHRGQLRSTDASLEARNIASHWAALLFMSNVGLAVAVFVHWRRPARD
jgi:hypothetical protein